MTRLLLVAAALVVMLAARVVWVHRQEYEA